MRAIDAAMEVLSEIADNENKLPDSWLSLIPDYQENGMSLTTTDIAIIAQVIARTAPCKFLEIGSGSSTGRLFALNSNGLNISLEDNLEWVQNVSSGLPPGQGILLHYGHHSVESRDGLPIRQDWKAQVKRLAGYTDQDLQINDTRLLQKRVMIPDWLWSISFDIILVDGPIGGGWEHPGRSGTTLLASKLAGSTSVIFIDDAPPRPHEMRSVHTYFADRYLHVSPSERMVVAV